MTPELKNYLAAWLEYADTGEQPENQPFNSRDGLCMFINNYYLFRPVANDVYNELVNSLPLQDAYPFGGKHTYRFDIRNCSALRNDMRLAWVRQQLGVL